MTQAKEALDIKAQPKICRVELITRFVCRFILLRAVEREPRYELIARDKTSLDLFWLRDESLEDTANLPPPHIIAAEIVEDLQAALAEFAEVAASLQALALNRSSDT